MQTAFLPAAISIDNETLPGLSIVNVSENPRATGGAPIPVSYRNLFLAFVAKGQPIPENEVRETLLNADRAIANLARDQPNQRILHDRFEYRRPNGNMLISIKTNIGHEITWMELRMVLQGLYRYMTAGRGTEKTHYQALEFEIEASVEEKPTVGLGLVWYFNPTKSEVQKRVTPPLAMSSVNEGTFPHPNLTFPQSPSEPLLRLSNGTLALLGTNNVQEHEIFPIPQTSLSLSFYFFGPSIPVQSVKATLQGAIAKIRPFLNGPLEMDPIENGSFRWVLPVSHEADIPVAVTVFTYRLHEITWRQLFDVLFGLYAFATTFGTDLTATHYQVLGFRIVDLYARHIGVGTISYFRAVTSQLAKRVVGTIGNGILLQSPSTPNISSLNPVAVLKNIVYPVANTDVILTFTYLGDTPIPPLEINGALGGAQQRISHAVVQSPDSSITGSFRDISTTGRVSTNIFAYSRKVISWKELDYILRGILQFCQDDQDHDRVLVFEIDIKDASRGRVGFGTLLYVQPDPISGEPRALTANDTTLQQPTDTTISQPSLRVLALPIPYPVPGTPITLMFNSFGSPIPSIYVNAAFTSALRKMLNHVIHHPNTPIPNDRWEHRGAGNKVWITIIAYNSNKISWQELSFVVAALLQFMIEAGEHHCRDLGFYIDKVGDVATGYGSVAYFPDGNAFGEVGQ